MATLKKTKKKKTQSKRTTGKKRTLTKKAVSKKPGEKRVTSKKKLAKKNVASRKSAGKTQVRGKSPQKSLKIDTLAIAPEGLVAQSGEQSGDMQGLSSVAGADSESVEELLEEGNTLEAGVVKGVEDAEDADEAEVQTHEVPENDVPGEYLEED